jgi:hypothetical protein
MPARPEALEGRTMAAGAWAASFETAGESRPPQDEGLRVGRPLQPYGRLKYFKSGGGWPFFIGMMVPSALLK